MLELVRLNRLLSIYPERSPESRQSYLPKVVSIPTLHAQLRQKLQRAYQHQHLKPCLGTENTDGLIRAHGKVIEYLRLSTQHSRRNEANAH